MASPYQIFKTNTEAEAEQGVTIDYGDFSFKLARAGGANKRFGQVLNQKLKPHRRMMENETMDNDLANKLMAEAYAETVVLGWQGITDEHGNELPFSRSACVKLFTDLPELFRDIQVQANSMSNFRAAEVDETIKNSPAASSGI